MPRIHAFELEDQPWLPRIIRDYATDFLQYMIERGDAYAPVAPLIRRTVESCGAERVVDLASGGGGPWLRLLPGVLGDRHPREVLLTDRFPSREAVERVRTAGLSGLSYHPEPVDAMNIPPGLTGFRTMFTALHHFREEDVRRILGDAVRSGQGIGAFEFSERSARGLLLVLFSPLLVLLVTPALRPFRWSRLLLTYAVPLVPLVVLFDGVISCLRSYTAAERRAIADSVQPGGYAWETGTLAGRAPVPVTCLVGRPLPTGGAATHREAERRVGTSEPHTIGRGSP